MRPMDWLVLAVFFSGVHSPVAWAVGRSEEIRAVLENQEIRAYLQVFKENRGLKCYHPIASDVQLSQADRNQKARFSISFTCIDRVYGANVHQVRVSGVIVDRSSQNLGFLANPLEFQITQPE